MNPHQVNFDFIWNFKINKYELGFCPVSFLAHLLPVVTDDRYLTLQAFSIVTVTCFTIVEFSNKLLIHGNAYKCYVTIRKDW